jgi:hypothetical protein
LYYICSVVQTGEACFDRRANGRPEGGCCFLLRVPRLTACNCCVCQVKRFLRGNTNKQYELNHNFSGRTREEAMARWVYLTLPEHQGWSASASRLASVFAGEGMEASLEWDPIRGCIVGSKCPIVHANSDQPYPTLFSDDVLGFVQTSIGCAWAQVLQP